MKLIVAGSTGFVGAEVIRQAIANPAITSVVALSRRETPLPQNLARNADGSKLKSVACEDLMNYPESVRQELIGADACIWTLGATPHRCEGLSWDEVRKVCLGYTVTALEALSEQQPDKDGKPVRFVYTSGSGAERDPKKKPWMKGNYFLMRGEVETRVLEFAQKSAGAIEACVVRPGLIRASERMGLAMKAFQNIACSLIGVPIIDVSELSAALIDLAIDGVKKDTLDNQDLVELGKEALAEQQTSP